MNDIFIYGLAALILLISDLALILLAKSLYHAHRPRPQSDTEENTAEHFLALNTSIGVLGERLGRIEAQLSGWQRREEQYLLPSSKEGNHEAIRVATRMALQGADVEELVTMCGLTRGEAELIRKLHLGKDQVRATETS